MSYHIARMDMNPHKRQELQRLELLLSLAPQIADGQGKTCLYIGASKTRFQLGMWLHEAGYDITLIETFPENAAYYAKDKCVSKIVCANILVVADTVKTDLVVWWHGPEHVTKEEMYDVLPSLERATMGVVLAAPYGKYIQEEVYGNPWEKHLWHPMPEDFKGYETGTVGRVDTGPRSCIVAWKESS